MARSRIVKPEFWDDEKLPSISFQSRLTYIGIWNFCDDYGVTKASPLWLKSRIFPYDEKLSIKDFEKWIFELIELKRIIPFSCNGDKFYYLPKFLKHQVINRPSKTRYPEPSSEILEHSMSTHGVLTDEIEIEREYKEKENTVNECSVNECSSFDLFWSAYPIKTARKKCEECWNKLKKKKELPDIKKIVLAIESQKKHKSHLKDSGKFCPEWKHPLTWLNSGCWDDEVSTQLTETKVKFSDINKDADKYGALT